MIDQRAGDRAQRAGCLLHRVIREHAGDAGQDTAHEIGRATDCTVYAFKDLVDDLCAEGRPILLWIVVVPKKQAADKVLHIAEGGFDAVQHVGRHGSADVRPGSVVPVLIAHGQFFEPGACFLQRILNSRIKFGADLAPVCVAYLFDQGRDDGGHPFQHNRDIADQSGSHLSEQAEDSRHDLGGVPADAIREGLHNGL